MKIKASWDDGCASDMRVAELMDKYDVETVFYWPVEWHMLAYAHGYTPLPYDEAEQIAKRFEIGAHSITHRHLTSIPEAEAKYEIAYSKPALQNLFRVKISKFCPPRGYTNGVLTALTLKLYESQRLTKGSNLVHIHPDSGGNDNLRWQEAFKQKTDNSDEIEIWGHSWELDKYNLWDELEEFLSENLRS